MWPRQTLRVAGIWLMLWLLPVVLLILVLGADNVFSQIAVFFSKMAMVTFGGASQQAVEHYGWLKPGEMLDGLGMAETTPGPLIMVLQFVGFLAAFREPGGLAAAGRNTWRPAGHLGDVRALLPVDLSRAPYIETIRGNRALSGAFRPSRRRSSASSSIWRSGLPSTPSLLSVYARISVRAHVDVPVLASVSFPALMLSASAILAMFRFKSGVAPTLAACSLAGMVLLSVHGRLTGESTRTALLVVFAPRHTDAIGTRRWPRLFPNWILSGMVPASGIWMLRNGSAPD